MDRRQFLWLTGAAGGAMALAPMVGKVSSVDDTFPGVAPGVESFTTTTCLMCPGGCGLKVRRVDGFPVGIAGNPNHPLNGGGVCSDGIAALQLLYHPDRLLEPMRRIGRRRSNRFEPTSWDTALDEVSTAMRRLRENKKTQKLGFVLGRTGGTMEELVKHFMYTWGSPNLFLDEPQDGYTQIFEVMHGLRARPAFDFDNASLVLSFGVDLLESWQSPLQFQRSYASFHAPSRSLPGKLVVADTRFSRTAARANEWLGIMPGSYGALALGIAYVVLREKLYDTEFVEQHLYGFEDFNDAAGKPRLGYRSLVLRDYSPEVVSRLTGVPVERILALGKALGESPAALALFDENVVAQPGGMHAAMAIHSLNLIKGNLNRRGGLYLQPKVPLTPLSGPQDTPIGGARTLLVEELADLASTKDSLDIVFLYYSNPLYSSPLQRRLEEALAKIPLIVSFSPFWDETSRLADLVLPDALFLERWEDRLFPSSSAAAGWSIIQPCVRSAGQSRHSGDVLLELARGLGSPLAEAFPWKNFEELLRYRARGLYEAKAGTLCVDPSQQGLLGEMERRGWWIPGTSSFDEFWQGLLSTGAWLDPNYEVRGLRDYSGHHDGKMDLWSRTLERKYVHNATTPSDIEFLPHYHAGEESSSPLLYSMALNPYRLGKLDGGTNTALPWILQAAGSLQNTSWNSWAEIHPADAQRLGIKNHDWTWIESPNGRVKVRAVVYPGTGPGVVNLPCGLGHSEMGRWARGRGVNPLILLSGKRDPLFGISYRFGTKVKISKA